MKKRFLIMAASAMLAFGLAACGQASDGDAKTAEKAPATTEAILEAVPESTDDAAGSDWYMEALTDPALVQKYSYYKFVDLNGDGVPFLFLSTTEKSFIGGEDHACLIAFVEGRPQVLKEIGGAGGESFYCDTQNHTLTYFSRLSGEGHLEVYQLTDGSLNKIDSLDNYGPMHDPESNGENKDVVRRINGKDVSEEEYTAAWDKYASEKDIITYDDKIELPK